MVRKIKVSKKQLQEMSVKSYNYPKENKVRLIFGKDEYQIDFKDESTKSARYRIVFGNFNESDIKMAEIDNHILNIRKRLMELGQRIYEIHENDKSNEKAQGMSYSKKCIDRTNNLANEITNIFISGII